MIVREPDAAAGARYDLLVIGGGIYGATLALEAARRSLRPLLLERGDFGQGTSGNSLRILHGGLRYLQTLDLPRFRQSVSERRWFFRHFPTLVEPLACAMPLYGQGLRRPAAFRAAFLLDRVLSCDRNRGLAGAQRLPSGHILDADRMADCFPAVERAGLVGGALWHDAAMVSSQRLLMEILRWAATLGAGLLNHVEVESLVLSGGRVGGVRAIDRLSGERLVFEAPLVANCAGPRSRALAARFDRDLPALFRPVLAFNLFLARKMPSAAAIALTPEHRGARSYFLRPWQGGLLLGTEYAPWSGDLDQPRPSEAQIRDLLTEINRTAPALELRIGDVAQVFAGLLPGTEEGSDALASHDVLWDHGVHGGPKGLFSLSGVKFTTARSAADRLLRRMAAARHRRLPRYRDAGPPPARPFLTPAQFARLLRQEPAVAAAHLRAILAEESVLGFEDLRLRRLDWPTATEEDIAPLGHMFRSLTSGATGS